MIDIGTRVQLRDAREELDRLMDAIASDTARQAHSQQISTFSTAGSRQGRDDSHAAATQYLMQETLQSHIPPARTVSTLLVLTVVPFLGYRVLDQETITFPATLALWKLLVQQQKSRGAQSSNGGASGGKMNDEVMRRKALMETLGGRHPGNDGGETSSSGGWWVRITTSIARQQLGGRSKPTEPQQPQQAQEGGGYPRRQHILGPVDDSQVVELHLETFRSIMLAWPQRHVVLRMPPSFDSEAQMTPSAAGASTLFWPSWMPGEEGGTSGPGGTGSSDWVDGRIDTGTVAKSGRRFPGELTTPLPAVVRQRLAAGL